MLVSVQYLCERDVSELDLLELGGKAVGLLAPVVAPVNLRCAGEERSKRHRVVCKTTLASTNNSSSRSSSGSGSDGSGSSSEGRRGLESGGSGNGRRGLESGGGSNSRSSSRRSAGGQPGTPHSAVASVGSTDGRLHVASSSIVRDVADVDTTRVSSAGIDAGGEVGSVDHVDVTGTVRTALDDEGLAIARGESGAVGARAGDLRAGSSASGSGSRSTLDNGISDGCLDWASQGMSQGDSEEEGKSKGLDGHVEKGDWLKV